MENRHVFRNILLIMTLITIIAVCHPSPVQAQDLVIVGPENFGQLQEALEAVNAGGTVLIQAGQYQVPRLVIDKSLTIRGEDGVILLAAEDTSSSGASGSWLQVESGCLVELQNLCLNGNDKRINSALYGSGTLIVRNCSFTNIKYLSNKGRAIVLLGDNSVVEECSFSQIGRTGIHLYSCKNALLQRNTYTGKDGGDFLDYGIEADGGAEATICHNTIRACKGILAATGLCSAGIMIISDTADNPSRAIIKNNIISTNHYGVLVGATANDCSQVQIENNDLADNLGSAVKSSSHDISAEKNYWGAKGPLQKEPNALPDWLDFCPWAVNTSDENNDGEFDQLAYLLELQWNQGGTELQLNQTEPGSICSLSFMACLNALASQTTVSYIMEWSADDPDNLLGITINGTPLQNSISTITDTLQPGQSVTYDINVEINTPGTYTVSLYAVRL
jgi:hypothetical protein